MSTKADKGDRKREIEQSPMKKKFRDSAISSEELDSAIASRIELAFKEHKALWIRLWTRQWEKMRWDSVLIPALRELREDILATNKSVRELREEFWGHSYQDEADTWPRWFCPGSGARR